MSHRVTFKGSPVQLSGQPIKPGDKAPDFQVVANDLSTVGLPTGRTTILLAVPSLDTGVCDMETRRFNQEAANLPGVEMLVISMDLPFAQQRWCGNAGVDKVRTASDFRGGHFGKAYGTLIADGPMAGLEARAVFVVDPQGIVRHVEYVADIAQEPNYAAAIAAARQIAAAPTK